MGEDRAPETFAKMQADGIQQVLIANRRLRQALEAVLCDQGCNEDGSYVMASARAAEALLEELDTEEF